MFSLRRRNKDKRWLLFTRGLLDKLVSFIIAGRTTYTAATRHLSADVRSFCLRRQDVVKLGTAIIKTFEIPPESGRCPLCGPNPAFIVIDAQALGCSDPDDTTPLRPGENCPVLDIPASQLCLLEKAPLREAVSKVLRSSTALTASQVAALRTWHATVDAPGRPTPAAAAAKVFFHFFPLGEEQAAAPPPAANAESATNSSPTANADAPSTRKRRRSSMAPTLESAVRVDKDGKLVLGGKGPSPKKPVEVWSDRVGLCRPAFELYPLEEADAWCAARPFLHAMLTETICGMFQSFDEAAVKLLANAIRIRGRSAWRHFSAAADGVGYVASFLGCFADDLDEDRLLRASVGEMLLKAVSIEKFVDRAYEEQAAKKSTLEAGWQNAKYCARWKGTPTPADYLDWRMEQKDLAALDDNDPLVSYEYFAGLPRVRPGIMDSEAAKRRVQYRGKDRHVADLEGEGDACNKAFSIKAGLTQGVFNVVCPHVITLGFRCLFRAESVGEALSIVLERFPKLPRVIFYDVACKLDKNAMRRVRPIMRAHGVRCILDRSHSITHTCSPIYMPDDSLGSTAGVATQAAEVSHSVAVVNRTSLAYMAPATYMVHKMVQVAFMNVRKQYRLSSDNSSGENDHVWLAPFFHTKVSHQCTRISSCSCKRQHSNDTSIEEEPNVEGRDNSVGAANDAAAASSAEAVLASSEPEAAVQLFPATNSDDVASRELGQSNLQQVGNGVAVASSVPAAIVSVVSDAAAVVDREDPSAPAGTYAFLEAGEAAVDGPATDADLGATVFVDLSSPVDEDVQVNGVAAGKDELDKFLHGWLLKEHERVAAGRLLLNPEPMDTQPLAREVLVFSQGLFKHPPAQPVRPRNKGRIHLTGADFLRLAGESWLNDELINSFVALINDRDQLLRTGRRLGAEASSLEVGRIVPRTRMMNSFFFSRLAPHPSRYNYEWVRNWGLKMGLDLDAVDKIIVPVNLAKLHWVLVAIDISKCLFYFYDSITRADRHGVVDVVRRWLGDEVRSRLGDDAVARWDVDSWAVRADPAWPRQTDAGSCGVFAVAAADCFSLGAPLLFSQKDIRTLRERIAVALFFDDLCVGDEVLSAFPVVDSPPGSDGDDEDDD